MDGITVNTMKGALDRYEHGENFNNTKYKPLPAIKPISRGIDENELNRVFSKVQSDINLIKSEVLTNLSNGAIDYQKIQAAFERAENEIQSKKVDLLTQFNSKAKILQPTNVFRDGSKQWDDSDDNQVDNEERPILTQSKNVKVFQSGHSIKKNVTPGQKLMALQKLKCIINPSRPGTRALLKKHYGVPLTQGPVTEDIISEVAAITGHTFLGDSAGTITQSQYNCHCKCAQRHFFCDENGSYDFEYRFCGRSIPKSRPVTGTTISRLAKITVINPANGRVTPPPITNEDARKGVLSLIERKLIPAASRLSVSSPMKQTKMTLFEKRQQEQQQQNNTSGVSRPQYNLALVKFDESIITRPANKRKAHVSESFDRRIMKGDNKIFSRDTLSITDSMETDISLFHTTSNQMVFNKAATSAPLPTPYLDSSHRPSHKFIIQNGITRVQSQDFLHFKQYYCLSWGSIENLLRKVEMLLTDYSVPIAFIDGDKLADLALFFEVGPKPTIRDLLMCVLNKEDVQTIIQIPGRRYIATDGKERAAIKIQSIWRRYLKRYAYLEYRRRKWSAGIIALTWIMKCKMTMIRTIIKENQQTYLQNHRLRAKQFVKQWPALKNSKRLIVHIPSYGYDKNVRANLDTISTLQNKQIGRIFDVKDPNVEVIYISPVTINKEVSDYYVKLLQIMPASIQEESYEERLKFFTPTHHNRFPYHNLCLSTILKYSTNMIFRLASLVKGKQGYIVPGMMHNDDLFIAEHLGLPILGTEPEIAHLYSLKSGIRRIFEKATVSCPPGEHDVYSLDQIFTSLSRLVTSNLHITRWLFKIDNQRDGCGTAYCDFGPHLSYYKQAMKEKIRYGDKWKQKWAHELTYNIVLKEMPSILTRYATPVDKNVFNSWQEYLITFIKQGGVIEACPPSDSVTGLTTNILIEPDGNIQILSVADQVHSTSPYNCWGYTLPQSSIDPSVVNAASLSIGESCKKRGILGYCSIDFVTFIDPLTDNQELWAVGLNIGYSDSLSMVQLMKILTNGSLDCEKNILEVTVNKHIHTNSAYQSKRKKSLKKRTTERKLRYCVLSTNLLHSNLNNVHYSVFFQMCKAHGIGFDNQIKVGTTFTLIDRLRREAMGMLTVGETLEKAVSTFSYHLSTLHNEISSITMPGKSNFQGAIADLAIILESLKVNLTINQNNYPTVDCTDGRISVLSSSNSDNNQVSRSTFSATSSRSSAKVLRSPMLRTPCSDATGIFSAIIDSMITMEQDENNSK